MDVYYATNKERLIKDSLLFISFWIVIGLSIPFAIYYDNCFIVIICSLIFTLPSFIITESLYSFYLKKKHKVNGKVSFM